MDKQEYIGKYLEKKLKNCKLPYGMQYLSLVSELTDKAEKLWNIKHGEIKSQQIINTNGKENTNS